MNTFISRHATRSTRYILGALCWLMFDQHTAAAQSCHAPSLRPANGSSYRATLASSFASFGQGTEHGEYQGLFATLSFAQRWFVTEVSLPGYRIARIDSHAYGLGDLAASVRGSLYQSRDAEFSAGPELAATLPTGSTGAGLGMGHVMLMPGAFVLFQHAGLSLLAQLAYGRALAGASAHHHAGPMPVVNPMNRSELTHAFGVSTALHPNLRIMARWLGAVHVFDHTGSSREIIAPGLQIVAGTFDLTFEFQIPVVGSPFVNRSVVSVGAQW
jgi:hypothetical protein